MVQAVADGASVHITDCLVKGSITDNAAESERAMAGFVMSNSGTYTLTRCLYVGKNNAANDKYSKTFGETGGYGATFTDCYYLNTCGKAQGDKITEAQLKNGYVAYKLQKGIESQVWGQTLGTDTIPQPTTDATKRVYEVKFTYNGEVKATRYATNGQSIHGGLPTFTAKDLLGTGYNPHHYYAIAFADGFNASTTVTADRQVAISFTEKDCYEITSKADWKAFCALVEDGQTAVDAKMTKDVDLETDITMAGTANKPYAGTFDGQNHTLTVNWDAGSANDVAPFGRVNGATIKNLRTEGSIRSNSFYLSGLIDEAAGGSNTVANCVSAVNITSSYTSDRCRAGGLISYIFPSARVTINDCLVKGSINATTEKGQKGMGGFVYVQNGACIMNNCLYAGTNNADNSNNNCYTFAPTNTSGATTTLNNCYYLNPCGEAQGTQVTAERLKSGEMAKLLQGDRTENVWGQTLGTDTIPQPTDDATKRVYEVKFVYNGEVKATRYANYDGNVGTLPTPQEILGVAYNTANTYKLVFADDFYAEYPIYADRTVAVDVIVNNMCEIATKEDWKKFGYFVRSGEGKLNARLTADIDLGGDILKIGSESTGYSGTFDGQGHTITVDWNGNGGGYIALFPKVTDATIKNLRVTGKMTSDHEPLSVFTLEAGGNTTFSGCVSDVKITNGDKNDTYCAAGMVRAAYSKGKITFKDCIVAGDLNGTTDNSRQGMGGFVCGQADDATCTFDNCLYTGTNNSKGGYTFAPNPTLNNCYYLNAFANVQGTPITAEQLASGEVAHLLQGTRTENVWGQTLGTDLEPLPTTDATKRVYEVKFTYDTYEKTSRYANNGQGIHGTLPTAEELLGAGYNPKLTYALNFGDFTATTPVTADKTVDVGVDVSGIFPIATKDDWKEFCGVVNNGVTAVDAKLTADVNLGTEVVRVGDDYNQYGGTFDGQGHTLSFDWTSQGCPAPFDFVDGATIKNLRTKGKITTSGGEASGLLGNAYGTTTISNCVSDVEITSSIDWDACEAAGLVQTVGYNGKVTVTDCVVKGRITATTEKGRKGMAGFVYELKDGGACTLTNCLYVGKNNGVGDECYTFAPAGITLNNCYYLNACGKAQGDKITEAQLKNGYVAHKLQAGRTDNVWGQTLGTDATPQPTTEKAKHVYKVDFKYMDEVKATRYANSGGRVKLPTAKELLGADYDAQKSYTLTFENGFSETTAINGDITVSVTVNVVTGINGVTNDDSTVRGAVYNLQGVRVAESSDAETLRRLPAGVYIVKGKKFVVR
ncbi:peptidase M26 [Prevotella denticola]|nr:peptidase M26 [Prevotella denticola]